MATVKAVRASLILLPVIVSGIGPLPDKINVLKSLNAKQNTFEWYNLF